MFYFSKSKYCLMRQCPKLLWLTKFKPELKPEDQALQVRFDTGNDVGDLAMGLFGDYKEVAALKPDGSQDHGEMIRLTEEYMEKGVENICEASFSHNGLYCAVDVLRKTSGGYAIYEVKSSTDVKPVYCADIAYQKYVLEHYGINVTGTYLVCIDNSYVRGEELDIHKLFQIIDVSDEVKDETQNVEPLIKKAEQVYAMKTEPDTDIGGHCFEPYECAFRCHCEEKLPHPNVFDLYRINYDKALELYRQGKADFETLLHDGSITNPKHLRQMLYAVSDQPDDIDKGNIKSFLSTLTYPLYFLDFETMQLAVPQFPGTKPYQQIPFQYSLHYIEREGGPLLHKEFLAESGKDPRRAIAERLCEDIPKDVCVTAYNKTFECGRINELAETFPDLAEHLLNIKDNIVDLIVPFRSGWYYNRAMGGNFSIKTVLPALFPNDPELDYHALEGVHNGTEAMTIFPQIQFMPPEEQQTTRHNLLKYCELDTLAMVKVLEKLKEAAK